MRSLYYSQSVLNLDEMAPGGLASSYSCSTKLVFLLVSIYLPWSSANVRTTRPTTANASAAVSPFSDFDADPVNFPASPKMYIEQLESLSQALIINVSHSRTQQRLVSFSVSYHRVAENEREQPLTLNSAKLPTEISLQNLVHQAQYNVCVRASFTPGDFALYTMQTEKVRNCTVFSTTSEAASNINTSAIVVVVIIVYILVTLLIGFAVYKLRKRFCKDRCKCQWFEGLVATSTTFVQGKWTGVRDYFVSLRTERPPAENESSRQPNRNAIEVSSTYVAVSQIDEANKRSIKNHSGEKFASSAADAVNRPETWSKHPKSIELSSQDAEPSGKRSRDLSNTKKSSEATRPASKSDGQESDSSASQESRCSPVRENSQNSKTNAAARTDDAVYVDVHASVHRSAKRNLSPRESGSSSKSAAGNEVSNRSNGSSHQRRAARNCNAPNLKLEIQNTSQAKSTDAEMLTTSGNATSPTKSHTDNADDAKSPPEDGHVSESDAKNDVESAAKPSEQCEKAEEKRECPQHGSIILTINPDTVVISGKKKKRKDRNETELSPGQLEERERFVRSFYEKLYARQRSDGKKQPAEDGLYSDRDREKSRAKRSGASVSGGKPLSASEVPQRVNETEAAKVSHRKQHRVSAPVSGDNAAVAINVNDTDRSHGNDANANANANESLRLVVSRRKAADQAKRVKDQSNTAPVDSERQRKRGPADSLDNDQTDDEVWILRASKV